MYTLSERLYQQIERNLQPIYLKVVDESAKHHSFESHFKMIVVSAEFSGLSLVKRHQKVYAVIKAEMQNGLHALSLHTFSPEEWEEKQQASEPETPPCRGGSHLSAPFSKGGKSSYGGSKKKAHSITSPLVGEVEARSDEGEG